MSHMTTWAFIQMRMNSSRLPQKPFVLIHGKTLIERVYNQVCRSRGLEGIAFLSTINPKDDELEKFYKEHEIPFYRGSENDIVERFLEGAKHFKADRIIRIWGDCPLIHPEVIEIMLERHIFHFSEMTTNSHPQSFPFGMNAEIYNSSTLQKIYDSTSDPYFREFPIEFVKKSDIKLLNVLHNKNLSSINLTVNYEEDLIFINKIYKELEKYPDKSLKNLIKVCSQLS